VPGFEVLQREGAADVAVREEAVFKVEGFEIMAIVLSRPGGYAVDFVCLDNGRETRALHLARQIES
jgi:hypothetical protein